MKRWLEHRIPPPVIFVIVGLAMWPVGRLTFHVNNDAGDRLIAAIILVAIGLTLGLAGGLAFRRASTTIDPHRPGDASALVVNGVYRLTRNPMYLGLAVVLVAWAVCLAAPVALAGPVLFAVYMTRFQIMPEERVLASKFGADYEAYSQKVRRWI